MPVYNSESFLENTLKCIAKQTMQDFELIMINDGSTDSSLKIIKDFCSKYSNFKYINKKNAGVASARNDGIAYAKGEYIAFIDSDDIVSPVFLEKLYSESVTTKAEIVCCNYNYLIPSANKSFKSPFFVKSGVYANKKALNFLLKDCCMHFYLWNKLWKRSLFIDNNITFPDMCFEDIATAPKLFFYSNKIAVINQYLYYYVRHDMSLVSSINPEKYIDYIYSIGIIRNFFEKNNSYKDYKLSFNLYCCRVILTIFKLLFIIHSKDKNFRRFVPNCINSIKIIVYYMSKNFKCSGNIQKPENIIKL